MQSVRWERPDNLKFPNTYWTFSSSDLKDNKKLIEYEIIDIPEDRYEEACDFMVKYFVPYEPKLVARNAKNDPQVQKDYYNRYMFGIKQKVSVACMRVDSREFIAVNILEVYHRNFVLDFKPQSKTCADIMEAVKHIEDEADLFNRYNVDYYLSGTGLAIDPYYRGRGIATEMIKARIPMLKFFGLNVATTGFSSIGAQKAAKKAGWIIDHQMRYEDLAKIRPNWNFLGTDTESYVQMSIKI